MVSLKEFVLLTFCILQFTLVHCDKNNPKVIVIGAGAAGIAAGTRLLQNGIKEVIVLEAGNRIGGRLHTADFDGDNVELGSMTTEMDEDYALFDLVNKTNLVQESVLNITESDFVEMNRNVVEQQISFDIQTIIDNILNDFESMGKYEGNMGKYLKERLEENEDYQKIDNNLKEKYLQWYLEMEEANEGVDLFHITAKSYSDYWQAKDSQSWLWTGKGIVALLDVLMDKFTDASKAIPLEEKILFDKEVTKINWAANNKNSVVVTCSDGSEYTADHVILTVSLGVLKKRMDTLFIPDLPTEKKTAIRYIEYSTTNIIYLKFPHRWWPENSQGFSLLWDTNSTKEAFGSNYEHQKWITNVFGFYPTQLQDNILYGFIFGKDAITVESLSDKEVLDVCVKALNLFLGKTYQIPQPTMMRSSWHKNPHFHGCGSSITTETLNHKTGPSQLAESLSNDINRPLVLFAGEATHTKLYSSVEGAIASGWRAADDVLEIYD